MINIVFEGTISKREKLILNTLKKQYIKKYKVGLNSDIKRNSKLYKNIKNNINENNLFYKEKFFTLEFNPLEQIADYLYIRETLYSESNDINFFFKNYLSIYSNLSILIDEKNKNDLESLNKILYFIQSGEENIDLLVFFDNNIKKAIKSFQVLNKYKKTEKRNLIKSNKKLKDFIRYNNSEYKLLVINKNDTTTQAVNKICAKIDEILIDKKKSEDEKWYELYKIDIEEFSTPDDYIKYKLKYKSKFIDKVMKYAKTGKVIEVGCGTGIIAGYLQKLGLKVTALDLSKKVLDYAKEIAINSSIISPCKYKQGNILKLPFKKNTFDVSFSNGVLEHFNDKEIIEILKQQTGISKYVIFGIPSTYFNMNEKMLGNERTLSLHEWRKLIDLAGGRIVEQSSFHYYKLYRRIFEINKWFKPKAFWLFIIEKKN